MKSRLSRQDARSAKVAKGKESEEAVPGRRQFCVLDDPLLSLALLATLASWREVIPIGAGQRNNGIEFTRRDLVGHLSRRPQVL